MAVSGAHLTSGGNAANGASYDTASVTPTGNQLVLLWVSGTGTNSQTAPTVSGNGLTWVQVASVSFSSTVNGYLFRAMVASPSAGVATIAWGAGNVTGCNWSMAEFDGVDTTGTNGSGAVVQSDVNTATATSLTVTLATAITSGNASAGGFAIDDDIDIVGGTGYTELGEGTHANPATAIGSEWRADGNVTVDASWATSQQSWGIAVEVKAAAGGAVNLTPADAVHAHAAQSPALTQTHELAPASAAHAHTADAPALTQTHELAPVDVAHGHTAESPALTQTHELTASDAAHGHTAASPALTQVHELAPVDALHAHTVEGTTVGISSLLTPDDSSHGHTVTSPALTQTHELTPANVTHAHTTDSPSLTQTHELAPVDSLHAHTVDATVVTLAQSTPTSRTSTASAPTRTSTSSASSRTSTSTLADRTAS